MKTASFVALAFVLFAALPSRAEDVNLKEGDAAPAFSAKGDDGKTYALKDLKGKYVVLYFYPKDDTSGCTMEAQSFRDNSDQLAARGAVVLGVSTDDAESHQAFRAKYHLNFPLLVNGKELAKLYGVPTMFALGYTKRQTFVIGPDGRIVKIWRDVDPKDHAQQVLGVLQSK